MMLHDCVGLRTDLRPPGVPWRADRCDFTVRRAVASCSLGDVIEGAGFHGAVFDVDGVLVDSPHEHAWRVALDQLFETSWTSVRDATQYTSERFSAEVYRAHISGKPTMSGARARR